MFRFRATLLPAALACAALASSADAATVQSNGRVVSFDAAAGERNDVTVALRDGRLYVSDSTPLKIGAGCDRVAPGAAVCAVPSQWTQVLTGDGDDRVTIAHRGVTAVNGGSGDDVLVAAPVPGGSRTVWLGGAGRDRILYPLGAKVRRDGLGGDGRAVDNDNVAADIEQVDRSRRRR